MRPESVDMGAIIAHRACPAGRRRSVWETPAMTFVEDSVDHGLLVRELDVAVGERPVTGVLWQREDPVPGSPLVCLGHGASGDRHQQPIPWLARRLVGDHGFAALSIDGPVHGRRQQGPGGREAFWPEWRREGTAADMVADWHAALAFVREQPGIADGPLGYWGLSMGTIYGAPLVAAGGFEAAVLGLMGVAGPDHYQPLVRSAAAAIACPVLFVVQLEDELFTREQCLELFDAIGTDDKRLHANPGLHPEVPMEELHACLAFLVDRLTGVVPERAAAFHVAE
jgi:dienelactone hydrolase